METWKNYREGLVGDGEDEDEIETNMIIFEKTLWKQKIDIFKRNIVTETLVFFENGYPMMYDKIIETIMFKVSRGEDEISSYDILRKFLKVEGIPCDIEKRIIDADLSGNNVLSCVLRENRKLKRIRLL